MKERLEGVEEAGLHTTEILHAEERGKMGLDELDIWKLEGDQETQVEATATESIESRELDAQSIQAPTIAASLLSEGLASRANLIPENHSNLPRSLLSSDQPLPPGHPCQGFTLPPPPADKKRTGPRREY